MFDKQFSVVHTFLGFPYVIPILLFRKVRGRGGQDAYSIGLGGGT